MGTEMVSTYDVMYKVVLTGDNQAGKSSILKQLVKGKFASEYTPTIGVDFNIHIVEIDGKVVKLQLWDTSGQQRFLSISTSYYSGADAIVYVYDTTDVQSFQNIGTWVNLVKANSDNEAVKMMVGNKTDLKTERAVRTRSGEEMAKRIGAIYTEASAKSGRGIESAFMDLTRAVKDRMEKRQQDYSAELLLHGSTDTGQ